MPDHGAACFDAVPGLVQRVLADPGGPDKMVLVWIDAFGWRFAQRHADHPLLRRIADQGSLERWTSQFPSTTSAHYATLHSTLPVAEHGIYEWFIYEPALDRMVCPLMFSYAGDTERGTLATAGPAVAAMFPRVPTLHQRLGAAGVAAHCFQDAALTSGVATTVAFAGATVHPFGSLADGLDELASVLRGPGPTFCFVYLDAVDSAGHRYGPDSAEFDATAIGVLGALERWYGSVSGQVGEALLLLTADHGMARTDPATTVYVNTQWPDLVSHLRHGADGRPLAPAGSARDLFLHVREGRVDTVVDRLRRVVGERAEVVAVADLLDDGLFGPAPSARLRDRVGDVVVLARGDESVWWWEPGRFEQRFLGHHGGLTAAEMEIPLGRLSI